MEALLDAVAPVGRWLLPFVLTLLTGGVTAWLVQSFVPWQSQQKVLRHLVLTGIAIATVLALLVALPFASETREQLLRVAGLIITGVIALASTTTISNLMAGVTLRIIGAFKTGDFVRVGEQFGRVTELGLLHTELQNEDRDLVTLPNLYMMTNPVRVTHASGTLISADVSIGYDVDQEAVIQALKTAAESAALDEPFVLVLELGDFSVSYRVSGFLKDVGNLVSQRSRLRSCILDALHKAHIEIASPRIIAQRQVDAAQVLIPSTVRAQTPVSEVQAERLMFEKADIAARIETLTLQREQLLADIEERSDADKDDPAIRWRRRQVESIDELLNTLKHPIE